MTLKSQQYASLTLSLPPSELRSSPRAWSLREDVICRNSAGTVVELNSKAPRAIRSEPISLTGRSVCTILEIVMALPQSAFKDREFLAVIGDEVSPCAY
jgi:hypothetical protein